MDLNSIKQIKLRPKKEESLKRFHPWVFSGAIASLPNEIAEGELVRVFSSKDEFLGIGHYQIGSISVRILSFEDKAIDLDFYKDRIYSAYTLRHENGLISDNNHTYRLVHGEGDNLPGLIVDIYESSAVVQAHSVGMDTDKELIVEALKSVFDDKIKNIFYKSEGTLPYKADIDVRDGYLYGGKDVEAISIENGLKFNIDWLRGQKTGFFIDQRDNRSLLEQYSHNRDVLNMFCYTGAFSVYALRGGAKSVMSVDSSSKAVMLTNENVELNFPGDKRHTSESIDAFKYLRELDDEKHDLIILDPPAFAKHRAAIKNALQGYKRINAAAIEKIKPGGILFTFSCSQVISKDQFRLAVFSAAAMTGRKVRILHQLTQPADHPINIYHPEGEYLKGLVLHIE